ncbi:MAG: HAMP domain-containing histidine kinase [Gammaproteobacteria bacterium]|nr:HAMP domain-containing histidine kinase [Gammaproteobacteria bacterium]MBU1601297.1 HAMP domain-containing histidine kinase [Gammaproteobacteria bacterium]MBU2433878.1 HAMP domain-containing histidine kinase [Gammaproteobacteria bacterium]MBU2450604.1 HAMP domain-containing histidine kinase [Gammaproteobacteria bacterium]
MRLPAFMGGIRGKLIGIFVLIKVVPLLLLAGFAWYATSQLGADVATKAGSMADAMLSTIKNVGQTVTDDSIRALDQRSREAIESLTTNAAKEIADFLHDRDADIRQAASLEPSEAAFRRFLSQRSRPIYQHGPWKLAADGQSWEPEQSVKREARITRPVLADNARDFHTRPPEYFGEAEQRPLFVEMTFVDPDGNEQIKVTTGQLTERGRKNVVDRSNTFVKAENYFAELKKLKPGDIYVSDVIGAYVPTHTIGPYLPASLEKAGKPFKPEESAYAGTENPVGKRFRGIVRWAMPVVRGGRTVGYVTLALDHDHIRQFSDRLMPTDERYTPIADAIKGNYAFIWDYKSRSISHPRDYFIVGYDPQTGQPATPWMDADLYAEWQASGKPSHEFLADVPAFRKQSLKLKPAREQIKAGTVGLDCRYLNFSPQCDGWNALTEHGGSGSFVIYFSGLWKLTTAAAIPYYTGQYGKSPQGFGFVTIGANVDEFHKAATETAAKISQLVEEKDASLATQRGELLDHIAESLTSTGIGLWTSTLLMVAIVIAIAIWMAGLLTRRITAMISGIHAFQEGDRKHRLEVGSADEMGELSRSFNRMADSVEESFKRLEEAKEKAEEASRQKSAFLATMSHELRTPLNGILGFAELLGNELDNPEQRGYVEIIEQSGGHLLNLVNEILDLAKIESGEMRFARIAVPLTDLLIEVAAVHRVTAEAKGLTFQTVLAEDLPAEFITDPTRLRQILNNLLSNAVKFTDAGSVVFSASRIGGDLAFAVRDTGPGIPPESRETIFEKFKQLENFLTREHGGTGLGLALVRQLAEHMGGRVTLESEMGVGSTFTVHLPLDISND